MEAAAAFVLSGTILQFIDSGTRFVGHAWKLYHYGSDTGAEILLDITQDLHKLLPGLRSAEDSSGNDAGLIHLANECHKTNV